MYLVVVFLADFSVKNNFFSSTILNDASRGTINNNIVVVAVVAVSFLTLTQEKDSLVSVSIFPDDY